MAGGWNYPPIAEAVTLRASCKAVKCSTMKIAIALWTNHPLCHIKRRLATDLVGDEEEVAQFSSPFPIST